jgi:S-adenosylmethionine:tRNA ribosyltransferase-isomerase
MDGDSATMAEPAPGQTSGLTLADFDYELPRKMIAAHPAHPRDAARLLDVGPGALQDHVFRDLPGLLAPGDLLVFNDTKVIPARLAGTRGAARVEATLHKELGAGTWAAFARPAKRLKPGDHIDFAGGLSAEVAEKRDGGEVVLRFDREGAALMDAIARAGIMPLPPYIPRERGGDRRDLADYQTIFAARPGAVAAPTAALHFTHALMAALKAAGIETTTVTLHVGAGTFLPVKAERIADHVMHAERGAIPAAAAEAIVGARARGGRIVCVGTTTLRLLESQAGPDSTVRPGPVETDLFITPGYRFRVADLLITNFHLPRSTLLMLAAAFAGHARIMAAYEHAKAAGYRFYSYGDACLLHPAAGVRG